MIDPAAVGDNAQLVSATGLSFSLAMAGLLLGLPRRYAMIPIIVLVCYMTMGERIVVMGLNFTMIRILLLFGWLRLLIKGELCRMRWNSVDKLIIAWAIVRTVNYTLVWGTSSALINRLGYAFDIAGAYFLFRYLVRDEEDVYRAIRYLALFIGPLALFIALEKITGRNAFAVFGGVPAISEIRNGILRCQGPFGHSILAGTFGATAIPLFVGLWLYRRSHLALAALAILSSTIIVAMSGSSGPVLGAAFGLLALGLWPIRRNMRAVRWGLVLLLVILHFTMNSPVWFVIARASVFSGSTGWFRGFLIDMSIRHLSEWWLIGTNAYASWHYYLADVTNQYLVEGFSGGLLGMGLFIGILAYSFRSVGRRVHSSRINRKGQYLAWALGAVLLAHTVTFISVSYFDQNAILFYLLLAAIASLSALPSAVAQKPEVQPAPQEFLSPFSLFMPDPHTRYSR